MIILKVYKKLIESKIRFFLCFDLFLLLIIAIYLVTLIIGYLKNDQKFISYIRLFSFLISNIHSFRLTKQINNGTKCMILLDTKINSTDKLKKRLK